VIQEVVKAAAIFLILFWLSSKPHRAVAVGAFLGAAFGAFQACHLTSGGLVMELFDWHVFNQIFLIVFHATAGALVGHVLSAGWGRTGVVVAAAVTINSLFGYLAIFVLRDLMDPQLVYLLSAVIAIFFLLAAVVVLKRSVPKSSK